MEVFEVFLAAYLVVTIGAMVMTYREQCRSGQNSLIFNLIGYVVRPEQHPYY